MTASLLKEWNQLKSILSSNLTFPISRPQNVNFGFWYLDTNKNFILNHLLLISKFTFTMQEQKVT